MKTVALGTDESGAILSDDGYYRYRLWRRWDLTKPTVLWIMLNPSTADHQVNDPTILAIIDFAKRWGYGGIDVVNLYAYRTRDPEVLKVAGYPVGDENDKTILALAGLQGADVPRWVMCAWGTKAQPERVKAVLDMIEPHCDPHVLGFNQDLSPKHPLYVKRDTRPYRYERLW